MRALLLAAGLGTRLRPITDTIPKCLVPVAGRPLLDYWFDLLFAAGVERALVNTHYFADRVQQHIAGSPWKARIDQIYETELLGTGGTFVANRNWFGPGAFLLAHADNLTDFDLAAMQAKHAARPAGCVMTMLAFHMIVNIGMTIGMMPITGIPLPFMSYGGSALITDYLAAGILINVALQKDRLVFGEAVRKPG